MTRMFKGSLKLVMLIIGILTLTLVGFNLSSAGPLVIKLAHHHNVAGLVDQTANKFAELVKEKGKGEIEIQVFPAAQLGQEREEIDGVHMGTINMAIVSPGLIDKYQKVMGIESLPFVFDNWDHADGCLYGPVGEKIKELLLKTSNIRILAWLHFGFREMMFRKKVITSLDQFKGLKMRSPEAWAWIRMFELLGAKPTPVTWGEVYTAMQMGVADGLESPPLAALDMKFDEVTKSMSLTHHMFATMVIAIHEKLYRGLSDNQKNIIEQCAIEAGKHGTNVIARPGEEKAIKTLIERGLTVTDVKDKEEWRKAVKPMHEEFAKQRPGAKELFEMIERLR